MAKKKKKSKRLLETISQNGAMPQNPFLKLQRVDSLDEQDVQLPQGATVFTVGGSDVVAIHTPEVPELGHRETIVVRGFQRYPTWHEMVSAAQSFAEGTFWVAEPVSTMSFAVRLLDFDNMVDKGVQEQVNRLFAYAINELNGKIEVPYNEYLKMDAFLKEGGMISLYGNDTEGTYIAELIYEQNDQKESPEA